MIKPSINMQGLSLFEALIGLGLLGGLGYAGMKLTKNHFKAQKTVELGFEVSTTVQQIQFLMNSVENCTETFKNLDPAGTSVVTFKKKTLSGFEDVYQVGTIVPGNLKITSIKMDNTLPNLASDETTIKIQFSRGPDSTTDEMQKVLRVQYRLNPSKLIESCYAVTDRIDIWQRTSNPVNIYYELGKVGVGTNDPKTALDVNGQIKLGTPGDCDITTEGSIAYDYGLHKQVICAGNPPTWKNAGIQKPIIITEKYRNKNNGFAQCPADHTLIGGGCDLDGNSKNPDLISKPTANGWYCQAENPDGNWDVFAYAICMPD